mmetsp:Transcript_801/g.1751  ORF Transcript_801/g.1751 Transcript_801/m.1751 type:complete len:240 (-) Transcript_801:214-933(-)
MAFSSRAFSLLPSSSSSNSMPISRRTSFYTTSILMQTTRVSFLPTTRVALPLNRQITSHSTTSSSLRSPKLADRCPCSRVEVCCVLRAFRLAPLRLRPLRLTPLNTSLPASDSMPSSSFSSSSSFSEDAALSTNLWRLRLRLPTGGSSSSSFLRSACSASPIPSAAPPSEANRHSTARIRLSGLHVPNMHSKTLRRHPSHIFSPRSAACQLIDSTISARHPSETHCLHVVRHQRASHLL